MGQLTDDSPGVVRGGSLQVCRLLFQAGFTLAALKVTSSCSRPQRTRKSLG